MLVLDCSDNALVCVFVMDGMCLYLESWEIDAFKSVTILSFDFLLRNACHARIRVLVYEVLCEHMIKITGDAFGDLNFC